MEETNPLPAPPLEDDVNIFSMVNHGMYNRRMNASTTWKNDNTKSSVASSNLQETTGTVPTTPSSTFRDEEDDNFNHGNGYKEKEEHFSDDQETSTLSTREDDNIDDSLRDELRELGLSATVLVPTSNTSNTTLKQNNSSRAGHRTSDSYKHDITDSPNRNSDSNGSYRVLDGSLRSRHSCGNSWGNESYLADLMTQREQREKLQQEEVMEEALDRYNALPMINDSGEKKTNTMFLNIIEDVQKEFQSEFQRRNELQDERIATEMLQYAEQQRQRKMKEKEQSNLQPTEVEVLVNKDGSADDRDALKEVGTKNDCVDYDYKVRVRGSGNFEALPNRLTEEVIVASTNNTNNSLRSNRSGDRRRRRPEGLAQNSHDSSSTGSQLMSSGSQLYELSNTVFEGSVSYHDGSINREKSASHHTTLSMDWGLNNSLDLIGPQKDDVNRDENAESLVFDDDLSLSSEESESNNGDASKRKGDERAKNDTESDTFLQRDPDQLSNAVAVLDGILAHIDNSVSTHRSRKLQTLEDSNILNDSGNEKDTTYREDETAQIEEGSHTEHDNDDDGNGASPLSPRVSPNEAKTKQTIDGSTNKSAMVEKSHEEGCDSDRFSQIADSYSTEVEYYEEYEYESVSSQEELSVDGSESDTSESQETDECEDDEKASVGAEGHSEHLSGSVLDEEIDVSRFWGREEELNSLRSGFSVATSQTTDYDDVDGDGFVETVQKHIWITGDPGIGKASLVENFFQQDDFLMQQSFICRGSFEENWMNTSKPFPGVISCFSDLFKGFLKGTEAEYWGEVIQDCIDGDDDIELLVLLIPSLGILLDVDNDDTNYSFEKRDKFSFERLSRALGRILLAICEDATVIFFLNNVHWADDDSLRLLTDLLCTKNLNNFFFIGSHRRGVKVSDSLPKVKADLSGLFRPDIKLAGIDVESAKSIVRGRLRKLHKKCSIDNRTLNSFVESLYSHSNCSNPLYLEHLVHLLYEQDSLTPKGNEWVLDSNIALPFSAQDLILERMEGLPSHHDVVLQSAALLDVNEFGTDSLLIAVSTLSESHMSDVEIGDVNELENILNSLTKNCFIQYHPKGYYTFAHDVIRTVATSRIPSSNKKKRVRLHWRLGTNLRKLKGDAMKPGTRRDRMSLLIADHLYKGISAIKDENKVEMVVKLYVQLAEAAMKRSAFAKASEVLETGIAILDKKSRWEASYGVTLESHLMLARCLYCMGDLDKAKSLLNTIIANGNPPRDAIDAFDLLISIYRSNNQFELAKQCTLKALADIWEDDVGGANVEEKFKKVRKQVQTKSDADLLILSEMEHRKTSKKMPFLLQLAEVGGLCKDYKLQDLAALRMMELTLKYGSYEINFTGLAFALCGLCVARRHLHGEAHRYGRIAEMMSEKGNSFGRQAIAHNQYSMRHWRHSMRGSQKSLFDICAASIEANEIENLSFQVGAYISSIFYTGAPIDSEDSILEKYNQKGEFCELPESWNVTAPYNALMKLKGKRSKLVGTNYSDTKATQYELFFQMVTSVFMYDMEKAQKLNEKLFVKPGGCWGSYRLFMEGLIETYLSQSTRGKNKFFHQKEAAKFVDMLATWTQKGMYNSAHMANILKVELMIASDNGLSAKRASVLIDTAVSSAYQDGFPHHAALASERAGMYFFRLENETLASRYLSRALSLYTEWGAEVKIKQLESEFGEYLDASPAPMRCLQRKNSNQSGTLMFTEARSKLERSNLAGDIRPGRKRPGLERSRSPGGSVGSRRKPTDELGGSSTHSRRRPRNGQDELGGSSTHSRRRPRNGQDELGGSSTHSRRRPRNGQDELGGSSTHSRRRPRNNQDELGGNSMHSRRRQPKKPDELKTSSHHNRRKISRHKEINLDNEEDPEDRRCPQAKKPSLIKIGSWRTCKSTISNITDEFGSSRRHNRALEDRKSRGGKTKPANSNVQQRQRKTRERLMAKKPKRTPPSTPVKKKQGYAKTVSPKPKNRKDKIADAGRHDDDEDDARSYLLRYSLSDFDSTSHGCDFGESDPNVSVGLSDCEEDDSSCSSSTSDSSSSTTEGEQATNHRRSPSRKKANGRKKVHRSDEQSEGIMSPKPTPRGKKKKKKILRH